MVSTLPALAPQSPTCRLLLRGPSTIPEALGADACVAVDRIHALGPVAAPVVHAVIIVHLAELPAVARETFTPGTWQSKAVGVPGRLLGGFVSSLSIHIPKSFSTLEGSPKPGPQLASLAIHGFWVPAS